MLNHRQLDQVGRRALNDGIDRCSFGQVPLPAARTADSADRAPTAQDGTNITVELAIFQYSQQELLDPPIAIEVSIDVLRRLGLLDIQLFGQAEGTLPVNHPKIHRFGPPPHFGRHLRPAAPRKLGRYQRVNVLVASQRAAQRLILRKVGQHTQLDLRVIGR